MTNEKMSFLPEDYIERRVEMRTNVICLSLFGVVLAAVLGAYFVTSGQRSEVLERQKAINASFTEAAQRISQLDELQKQKVSLMRKARVTATLIEPVPRSNLLAALINRMPASLSMSEFELTSKQIVASPALAPTGSALAAAKKAANGSTDAAPALPDVPQFHVELSLIGTAPTDIQVAQYMASLARCPLLSDVDLVYSEETRIEDSSFRKFKIDMVLSPDADVRHIDPLLVERNQRNPMEGSASVDPSAPLKD